MPPHHHHPPSVYDSLPLGLLALIWEFLTYPKGQRLCWRYGHEFMSLSSVLVSPVLVTPLSHGLDPESPISQAPFKLYLTGFQFIATKNLHSFHTKMFFRQGFIGYEVFSIRYGQQYLSHKQTKISFKYRDCLWGERQNNGWFFLEFI